MDPSIVNYLNSKGQASDFASRTKLAGQYGIQGYTGTAPQNTQLLGMLQQPQQNTTQAQNVPMAPSIPSPAGSPQTQGSATPQVPAPNQGTTNSLTSPSPYSQPTTLPQGSTQIQNPNAPYSGLPSYLGSPQTPGTPYQANPYTQGTATQTQPFIPQGVLDANQTPYSGGSFGGNNIAGSYLQALQQQQQALQGVYAPQVERLNALYGQMASLGAPQADLLAVQNQLNSTQNQISQLNPNNEYAVQKYYQQNPNLATVGITEPQLQRQMATQAAPLEQAYTNLLLSKSVLGQQYDQQRLMLQAQIEGAQNQMNLATQLKTLFPAMGLPPEVGGKLLENQLGLNDPKYLEYQQALSHGLIPPGTSYQEAQLLLNPGSRFDVATRQVIDPSTGFPTTQSTIIDKLNLLRGGGSGLSLGGGNNVPSNSSNQQGLQQTSDIPSVLQPYVKQNSTGENYVDVGGVASDVRKNYLQQLAEHSGIPAVSLDSATKERLASLAAPTEILNQLADYSSRVNTSNNPLYAGISGLYNSTIGKTYKPDVNQLVNAGAKLIVLIRGLGDKGMIPIRLVDQAEKNIPQPGDTKIIADGKISGLRDIFNVAQQSLEYGLSVRKTPATGGGNIDPLGIRK